MPPFPSRIDRILSAGGHCRGAHLSVHLDARLGGFLHGRCRFVNLGGQVSVTSNGYGDRIFHGSRDLYTDSVFYGRGRNAAARRLLRGSAAGARLARARDDPRRDHLPREPAADFAPNAALKAIPNGMTAKVCDRNAKLKEKRKQS